MAWRLLPSVEDAPDYQGPILPGQKGKVVQWLDRQLSFIQGRPAQSPKNLVFDDTLVREVKKFQLAKGLVPKGIVGPQTIIHLNNEVGSDERTRRFYSEETKTHNKRIGVVRSL